MTEQERDLLIIKGTIADMPEDFQNIIQSQYNELKVMIEKQPLALMAIVLLGAEMAAKNEAT